MVFAASISIWYYNTQILEYGRIPSKTQISQKKSVQNYNKELISLGKGYNQTDEINQQKILSKMIKISENRKEILKDLVKKDTTTFFQLVILKSERDKLPPQVQKNLEKEVLLTGKLEVTISDDFKSGITETYYVLLDSQNIRYNLYFAQGQINDLTGSKIKIEGLEIDQEIGLETNHIPSYEVVQVAQQPLLTNKKTAILVFNFKNATTQPFTTDFVRETTFTGAQSVNNYYKETSFGKIGLTGKTRADGDVFGWYTIQYDNTACSPSAWADAVNQVAQAAGVDLTGYDHYVYAFNTASCFWWGLGEVGGRRTWVNSKYGYKLLVVGHELGHNFGLYHANTYTCKDANGQKVTISNSCTSAEYADPFDIMGNLSTSHFNVFNKGFQDWFETSNVQTITVNGTYTLYPLEKPTTGVQVLKIPRSYGQGGAVIQYYYLEFRQPYGFDNFAINDPVVNGISVRLASEWISSSKTQLLDATPSTTTFKDAALGINKIINDTDAKITIKTISVTSENAQVEITVPNPGNTCVHANPQVTISPTNPAGVTAGTPVQYTLTLKNNDNIYCANSTFRFSFYCGTCGLSYSFNPTTITLAPGSSGTSQATISSPSNYNPGVYTFNISGTNISFTTFLGTATAKYTVVNPVEDKLQATKVVSTSSAKPGDKLTYTLTIKNLSSTESLSNVTVTDQLTSGVELVSGSITGGGSYNLSTRKITWVFTNMTVSDQRIVSFQVTVQ